MTHAELVDHIRRYYPWAVRPRKQRRRRPDFTFRKGLDVSVERLAKAHENPEAQLRLDLG